MSLISSSTIYYINSADRLSGTDSDFLYHIHIPPNSKYTHACVLQVSIPKSFWIVQENEYFDLTEGLLTVNITVPHGNYSRKSFATVIQSLLNTNSPNAYVYAVTYPNSSSVADTGKYTFTVTGNGGTQPVFVFSNTNDLGSHMGFVDGSANNFVANTLTSTNVINLQAENCLYLHSDLCTNGNDDVLQEIFSNSSSDFSAITFQQQCVDAYSKPLTTNTNSSCRFYLADEYDRPINLNGQNLNVVLLLYRKNDIYEMLREFIRLKTIQTDAK